MKLFGRRQKPLADEEFAEMVAKFLAPELAALLADRLLDEQKEQRRLTQRSSVEALKAMLSA